MELCTPYTLPRRNVLDVAISLAAMLRPHFSHKFPERKKGCQDWRMEKC
jgi:hypothetical protein